MTLLVLAGTGDARRIIAALVAAGHRVVASLAGATRQPADLEVPTRIGGFGGVQGFKDYLQSEAIAAVIDATHPFADRITARTAAVCAELGLPYLYFLRPPWTPQPGDNWTQIDREEDAANLIAPDATVFLGTGRQKLDRFANLAPRRVICRQIDRPSGAFPFAGGEFLVGKPPFPVEEEIALFQRLSVDCLVVKNAGGNLSRSKLDAARALGIPVLMIKRPASPAAPTVSDVPSVVAWVEARCQSA